MPFAVILPILVPLCGGLLLGLSKHSQTAGTSRIILVATVLLTLLCGISNLVLSGMEAELWSFAEGLTLAFNCDSLAGFTCLLFASVFLLVCIYSVAYMSTDPAATRFHCCLLLVLGLVNGACLAANLLTLFIFFELTTLASLLLVLHNLSKEAISAAFKYLYYSITGAALAVIGLFFLHANLVSLTFVPGGLPDLGSLRDHDFFLQVIIILSIIGFAAKAGMFPLHAWLPAAHPVAPAPASALLSGVITKVGVLAVVRFVFYLIGPQRIRGTWVQYLWIALTLGTILLGSLCALREDLLKRRLAYSSVSQVSYILFGLSCLTTAGFYGALWHLVIHCLVKDAFFLAAGAISLRTSRVLVSQLRGLAREMPILWGSLALLALAAIGIPPSGGFGSKWFLLAGSLALEESAFSFAGIITLFGSALLAAAYLLPLVVSGYFPGREEEKQDSPPDGMAEMVNPGKDMILPMATLAAVAFGLGLFAGPLPDLLNGLTRAVLR